MADILRRKHPLTQYKKGKEQKASHGRKKDRLSRGLELPGKSSDAAVTVRLGYFLRNFGAAG